MINNAKNDIITSGFLSYLRSLGLSDNSIRFYKSDLSHFENWVISKISKMGILAENLKEVIPFLKPQFAVDYKEHLENCQIALKTLNRRLSTLRRFSEFLASEKILEFDFAKETENIPIFENKSHSVLPLANDFAKFLESEKASKNTIKNYIADVKHFLSWLEANKSI